MKVEVIELQIRVSCVGPQRLENLYLSAAELAKQIQVTNAHLQTLLYEVFFKIVM